MNMGDFKNFLATGRIAQDAADLPKGLPIGRSIAEDDKGEVRKEQMAKTFLKKTLAQHDAVYHKDGYKEGDECNFRRQLMKNDDADTIKVDEKPNTGLDKYGLVRFKDKGNGKREIVGIEDVTEVAEKLEGAAKPPIEKLPEMTNFEACKYGPYGEDDRPCTITSYGDKKAWKSKNAAIKCYSVWAESVEGSEKERYEIIRDFLEEGVFDVCDDLDHPTKEMQEAMDKSLAELEKEWGETKGE